MTTLNYKNKKRIAVVTNDQNRIELIDWAYSRKQVLTEHEVVATETTGKILEGVLNRPVNKLTGLLSGYQQIAAMITEGTLDIIIFLSDPMVHGGYEKEEKALLDLALTSNIIIAPNRTSADLIMEALLSSGHRVQGIRDKSGHPNEIVTYINE